MSEADALVKIAEALLEVADVLGRLSLNVGFIAMVLFWMLLFKDMGGGKR